MKGGKDDYCCGSGSSGNGGGNSGNGSGSGGDGSADVNGRCIRVEGSGR